MDYAILSQSNFFSKFDQTAYTGMGKWTEAGACVQNAFLLKQEDIAPTC